MTDEEPGCLSIRTCTHLVYRRRGGFVETQASSDLNLSTSNRSRFALARLDLACNELPSVPAAISSLTNLEHLWLQRNPITSVHPDIQHCARLKVIYSTSYHRESPSVYFCTVGEMLFFQREKCPPFPPAGQLGSVRGRVSNHNNDGGGGGGVTQTQKETTCVACDHLFRRKLREWGKGGRRGEREARGGGWMRNACSVQCRF